MTDLKAREVAHKICAVHDWHSQPCPQCEANVRTIEAYGLRQAIEEAEWWQGADSKESGEKRIEGLKAELEKVEGDKLTCPDCGGKADDRVRRGKKCGLCAYEEYQIRDQPG